MRKCLCVFLLVFFVCDTLLGVPILDHKIDQAALSRLATSLNIAEHADILVETQKHWLRLPGKERWEMEELSDDQKILVLNWAKEHEVFHAWQPTHKIYDKAAILGGSTPRMRMRLGYLKQLWEEGIRFNEIVWLTGERPLDARVDDLTDRADHESAAARLIWQEAILPEEMQKLPVVFIEVPMKEEGSFKKRPTTEDTIRAWTKTAPEPCSILFISNQPFCGYQFAVIKSCLPDTVLFDVAGSQIENTSSPTAAIILDSVARWLYQESLMQP